VGVRLKSKSCGDRRSCGADFSGQLIRTPFPPLQKRSQSSAEAVSLSGGTAASVSKRKTFTAEGPATQTQSE
jgi:hypothetical protein